MIKKAIIPGILVSLILLVGCNREPEVIVLDDAENGRNEANLLVESDSNLLSELQNEIIVSITEQTTIEADLIAISLGGNSKEMAVSVSFPKDEKVDDTMIQQLVKDSIKKFSETENVTFREENLTIKIEKY